MVRKVQTLTEAVIVKSSISTSKTKGKTALRGKQAQEGRSVYSQHIRGATYPMNTKGTYNSAI